MIRGTSRRVLRSGREGPIIPGPVDPSVEDPAGGRIPQYGLPLCSGDGFHPFDSTAEDGMGSVHLREDTISTVVDGKGWLAGNKFLRKVYIGKPAFHSDILSEFAWLGAVAADSTTCGLAPQRYGYDLATRSLLMEYVDGVDLGRVGGRLSHAFRPGIAVAVATSVISGLMRLDFSGIQHGDLDARHVLVRMGGWEVCFLAPREGRGFWSDVDQVRLFLLQAFGHQVCEGRWGVGHLSALC